MSLTPTAGAIASAVAVHLVLFFSFASQAWTGLHFTNEEIAVWKTRKDNGPYKDEWDAILGKATSWKNNPDPRVPGHTTNTCYSGGEWPGRNHDEGLRDAAFVYLVTGNTTYRDAARSALLAQTTVAGTNWSDTSRWCSTIATYDRYAGFITLWFRKLTYAYSYLRSSLSNEDRTTLDAWFLAGATHFDIVIHNIVKKRFPNRLSDSYSTCSSPCPGNSMGTTHLGGHPVHQFSDAWNNKGASINAAVAAVGTLLDNTKLKSNAKRFVQEWLKFATYPGGQVHDQHRWGGATPQHGYLYSGAAIGSILSAVDHLARSGDTSLYEYATSDGMFGTNGGPKSLRRVVLHFAGMTNGSVIEYASNTSTNNSDLIIDSAGPSQVRVEFVNITQANIYYKDPAIAQAYQKTLPSNWQTIGCQMLSGEWCTYPRMRFMFGQMEGKVWPYPQGSVPLPAATLPAAPTGLTVGIK